MNFELRLIHRYTSGNKLNLIMWIFQVVIGIEQGAHFIS